MAGWPVICRSMALKWMPGVIIDIELIGTLFQTVVLR